MTCPRCAELEERIAYLESELGLQRDADQVGRIHDLMRRAGMPGSTGGRAQAAEMVMALYRAGGRPVTTWQLLDAVPSPSRADRGPNIVKVWVVVARKALGRDAIRTVWGKGYAITEAGIGRVKAILNPEGAGA
jgi:DNA-binding response OmpR family regulator